MCYTIKVGVLVKVEKIKRDELFKLERDYIFHGSPKLFEIGKPYKAKCNTKNPVNEKNAIYGVNDLRFSIIFAFEKLPRERFSWAAVNENGKYIAELRDDTYVDDNAKGYLYYYDKSKFKPTSQGSAQHVCMEELKPLMVVEIKYKDYSDLFVRVKKENEVNL